MNLQYALDTLKAKLDTLWSLHKQALISQLRSEVTWYNGQLQATQYAIDVLEAAIGDAK